MKPSYFTPIMVYMDKNIQSTAAEHLQAVGESYDSLLGKDGQQGKLAKIREELLETAKKYKEQGNKETACFFECQESALKTLEQQILSETQKLLKRAELGEELKLGDLSRLRNDSLDFLSKIDKFLRKEKGAFIQGELKFESDLDPAMFREKYRPIIDHLVQIDRQLLKEGGLYAVSGGHNDIRINHLETLETTHNKLQDTLTTLAAPEILREPPITEQSSPSPENPPPAQESFGNAEKSTEKKAENWLQKLNKEKWMGKKGLAVAGATAGLGVVLYGAHQLLQKDEQQQDR